MAYNTEYIIEALKKHKGMVYLTAKAIGCSPNTIYNHAKKHPEVQDAIDEARQEMIDVAEVALHRACLEGEYWAVQFCLKTIGRKRGYVDRQEHEFSGPEGSAIRFVIQQAEPPDADS
jgi:hypothetical protein